MRAVTSWLVASAASQRPRPSSPWRRRAAALVVLVGAVSLTTCRIDDLLKPGDIGRLTVSELSMLDSARVGSAATRVRAATIDVEGGPTNLDFTTRVLATSTWLRVAPAAGRAPTSLTLTLDPAGLAEGIYRDTVLLSTSGPEETAVRVGVEFRIVGCRVEAIASVPVTVNETLSNADCVSPLRPGRFARFHRFTGAEDDSITVELLSTAFAPLVALALEGGASLGEATACAQGAPEGDACLRYLRLPADGTYLIEVSSVGAGGAGAYSLIVGRPRPPNAPAALAQVTADGSALAVGVGGILGEGRIQLRASLTDPDLDSLRMEVEVRPVAQPFTGVATATSAWREGPEFSLTVEGLSDDTGYHWRVRAVDATGRVSDWVSFGGNADGQPDFSVRIPDPPLAPTALGQFRADGTTPIAAGGATDEQVVVIQATVDDPDEGDQLRLEVEVRPVGVAFTGVATAVSALTARGATASVTIPGLVDAVGYRWRARVVDQTSRTSAWVAFGTDAMVADFRIVLTPTRLAFITQPSATTAGAAITPAVRVAAQDALGNTRTSFTGAVTVALASNPAGGVLSGTATVNAVNGIATFGDLRVDRAGEYTLRATADALEETSAGFSVGAGSGQQLVIAAAPTTATAGSALTPPVRAEVRDALGNVATGFTGDVTIGLGVNTAGGTLSGTLTVAAVAGAATFTDLRIDRAGAGYTLLATAPTIASGESAPLTVSAGAASVLGLVTAPPIEAASGAPFVPQPAVRLLDANGNAVAEAGRPVTASIGSGPGGGALAGASATTDANGVATFATLTVNGPAGEYTLAFQSTGLTAVSAPAIAVTAGAASRLVIVTPPSTTAASGVLLATQPVVRIADAAGNAVSVGNVDVTVSIATGGGTLQGTTTVATAATGIATFDDLAISGASGTRTLAFAADGLQGVTSTGITLGAGAAAEMVLEAGDGQTAIAGAAVVVAPAVRVRDASGNPVAGIAVTFAVTAGAGAVLPAEPALTDANGVAALTSWTLGTTFGANALTASVDGLAGSPITFTATGVAGPATALLITGGNALTGEVGTALGTPHEVRAVDANGNPVAGINVAWTPTGGGSVNPTASVTNADGRATTSRTLGPTPGAQGTTATATLSNGAAQVAFTITATVGGATQMAVAGGDAQIDTVGATLPQPLAVVVRDALNNPVQGVLVSWSVTDGGGSVDPVTSTTNAAGIATTSWTLGTVTTPTDSTQFARATAVGSPVNFIATSRPGAVNAAQTLVGVAPATIVASRTTPATITVTARDGFGNPVPGQNVVLAATGTGNALVQPSAPTAANGTTTGAFGATTTGARTISAVVGGVAATQQPIVTVTPAPSLRLAFVQQPTDVVSGAAIAPAITVEVLDSLGNRNTASAASITLSLGTNPTGATLGGTLTRAAAAGVATFNDITVDRAGAGYALAATSGVLQGALSGAFAVTPGVPAAARSSVSVAPTAVDANVDATVTVTVRDANDNPVPGVAVTLAMTGDVNTIGQPAAATDADGVATGTVRSTRAQLKTVSATAGATPITQTAALAVRPAAVSAAQSSLAAAPTTIVAGGAPSTLTVVARDAFDNLVSDAQVVLAASGSGNSLTQPGGPTDATGTATGTLASTAAEAKTVTATVDGVALNDVAIVTVGAGAVSAGQSSLVAATPTLVAGSAPIDVAVTVRDANGNPVPGAMVLLAATGAASTLTQPAMTGANGVATGTFTATAAGLRTISATANGTPVTQTAEVTVVAAGVSAAQSSVAVSSATISAGSGSATVTVTARDAFDNPVADAAVTFAATGTGNTPMAPGTTNALGVATALFSSSVSEVKIISASAAGIAITQTQAVTVTPDAADGGQSSLALSTTTATAGDTVDVTVTARDAGGNLVPGVTVAIAVDGTGNSIVPPAGPTDAQGVATARFVPTLAGTRAVSATVNGVAVTQTGAVTVAPAAVSAAQSTVGVAPGTITAGGAGATVTVTVRDEFSNPIAGASVTLAASGTGNTVTQPVGVTNAAGQITGTVASTVAETKTISATVNGAVAITQTAALTVGAGAASAAQSGVSAAPGTITAGGAGSTVTITVRDANANPIAGAAVALAVSGTGNTVTQPVGVTNAAGQITGSFTSTVAEVKTVTATVDGATAVTQTANVTVGPAAASAAQSTVSVDPTSITAGGAGATVTVTVRDQFSNPIAGATAELAVTGAGNTITQPAGVTNAAGQITGTVASTVAEAKTISATVNGATPVTQTAGLTVTAGAVSAAQSGVSVAPGTITAGGAGSTVTVTVRDANGNPIAGLPVTLAVSGTGNAITQPVGVTAANGQITGAFSSTVAEAKTVTATVNGTTVVTQTAGVTVAPGEVDATQSSIEAAPTSIVAGGGSSTITVTARDAFDNPVPGATVVLASSGTGNTVTDPLAVTDANGVATGTVASTVAETKTISATVAGTLLNATATVTVTSAAVSAAVSSVDVAPGTITAGGAGATVTVTVRDAFSNPVAGASVTLAVNGTGNDVTQPAGVTNAAGQIAGTVASTVAETKTVTATVNDLLEVTQTGAITVIPAAAATLEFVQQPTAITAGAAITPAITVRARDAFGNVATGFVGTVTLAIEAGTGTANASVLGTPSVEAVGGLATFGNVALDSVGADYRLRATATGPTAALSDAFAVTPGAFSLAMSEIVASVATVEEGEVVTLTLTVRDALGNRLTTGGLTVAFELETGIGLSEGTVGGATDNADGTYTAVLTATVAGTPATVGATINGAAVTRSPAPSLTVTAP